jgi:hypothetical protein
MATFAKLRAPEEGLASVECIYNRDLEELVDGNLLFHVLSDEVCEKHDIDTQLGEILIYNPSFRSDMSCSWVAQSIDFDFFEY